jgi:hypothetical protein
VVRAAQSVAGSLSSSHVPSPSSHATAAAVPPAQYSPGSQSAHTGGAIMVAGAVCTVPGAHEPTGTHVVWLGPDVYVPLAHVPHARSFMVLPGTVTYSPATHVLYAVQAVAFVVSL